MAIMDRRSLTFKYILNIAF